MPRPAEGPPIAVVVPAYNEQDTITRLLDSLYYQQRLAGQSVRHIIVDNGSTDHTASRIATWHRSHDSFPLVVVDEPEKGTGAASDTGFLAAVRSGADIIARTEADCVPEPGWLPRITKNFVTRPQLKLLGGKTVAVRDREYRWGDDLLLDVSLQGARLALSVVHAANYLKVVNGGNMAILASSYEEVGGIPRTDINHSDEDVVFSRRYLEKYGMRGVHIDRGVVVATSMRRFRAYGFAGMVGHHLLPFLRAGRDVDVR